MLLVWWYVVRVIHPAFHTRDERLVRKHTTILAWCCHGASQCPPTRHTISPLFAVRTPPSSDYFIHVSPNYTSSSGITITSSQGTPFLVIRWCNMHLRISLHRQIRLQTISVTEYNLWIQCVWQQCWNDSMWAQTATTLIWYVVLSFNLWTKQTLDGYLTRTNPKLILYVLYWYSSCWLCAVQVLNICSVHANEINLNVIIFSFF